MNFRISQSADQVKKTNNLQDKKNKKGQGWKSIHYKRMWKM